jgi:hypothetical protein
MREWIRPSKWRTLRLVGLAALVAVAVGGDTAGLGLLLLRDQPAPVATRMSTVAGDGAPVEVRLADRAGQLSISWRQPAQALPVVVYVVRAGSAVRTAIQLPAGTTEHRLSGLSPQWNYCVTVGLDHGGGRVVTAEPLCTARSEPPRFP